MLRLQGFGLLLFAMNCGIAYSDEGPTFKTVIPSDTIRFVQYFSEDKEVGIMLFDNFIAATEIGGGSLPSVATKRLAYVVQIESNKEVSVKQLIRGYGSTQGSASAMILVHAGGKSTIVDLEKATAEAKATPRDLNSDEWKQALKSAQAEGLTVDDRPDRSSDFLTVIETRVPAGKPLQTTVFLLVDRLTGDDGSGGLLTIDSIDFVVSPVEAPPRCDRP